MNKAFTSVIIFIFLIINGASKAQLSDTKIPDHPVRSIYTAIDSKDYLLGKYDYKTDASFVEVPLKYAKFPDQYLRSDAYLAFVHMAEDARLEGVTIYILSATRSFEDQKKIWNEKWTGKALVLGQNLAWIKDSILRAKEILKYSSMPCTSRHHWGTDFDIENMYNDYFASGEGLKTYNWLQKNASKYGFCQPYCEKGSNRVCGYEEERWHWSYMPIANECIQRYKKEVKYEDINGFFGDRTAPQIEIIQNYVLGINNDCR